MENAVEDGPVDILRREMGLEDGIESDDVVYKRETISLNGSDIAIRRVFVLYGSYRVGWVHDADIQHCMVCQSDFGFFKRKHHCRACGSVVCSTCSPYRAHVPNLGPEQGQGQGSTASRVCNNCFGLKISKLTQLAPKDMNGLIQDFIQKETSKENDSHTSHKKGATNENTAQCRASKKKEKRAELENVQFQLLEEPKYSKAYRRMRCIIPPFIATLNLHSLISTGLPKAVAERIWSKRSLWLIIMHKKDIAKIHIADLRSKYTPIGLDLTERYAVWYNLSNLWEEESPEDSGGDHSNSHSHSHVHNHNHGLESKNSHIDHIYTNSSHDDNNSNSLRAKMEWKMNFRVQMDEMSRKHARNELSDDHVRHSAYAGHEPINLFSHRATIEQLYGHHNNKNTASTSTTASTSNPKHYRSSLSDTTDVSTSSTSSSSLSSGSVHSATSSLHLQQQQQQPPLSPPSPASSTCSSLLSSASEHKSPVVPLFVHRISTATDHDEVTDKCLASSSHSSSQPSASGPNSRSRSHGHSTAQPFLSSATAPSSASQLQQPSLEQQRQKREERIQDRKRRASRGLSFTSTFSSSSSRRSGRISERSTSSTAADGVSASEQRQRRLTIMLSTPIELKSTPTAPSTSSPPVPVSATPVQPPPQSKEHEHEHDAKSCMTPAACEGVSSSSSASTTTSSAAADGPAGTQGGTQGGTQEAVVETPPPGSRSRSSSGRSRRDSRPSETSPSGALVGAALLSNLIEQDLSRLTVTATPLRDLMADNTRSQRENVIKVMERMRASDILLTASEATELLKYAVVNLMDMRQDYDDDEEEGGDSDDEQYESAMLSIIDILVTKCGADYDTLDRDGNNLLTFLQESVTPDTDMHMSSRLVSTLVGHGINILVVQEEEDKGGREKEERDGEKERKREESACSNDSQAMVLAFHPLFVSLSQAERLQLVTQFSSVSSVLLSTSQKFTYFSLLVVIGRACVASLVLGGVRGMLTKEVASALLRICRFDADCMEEPLETFELLDKLGATF